jgi:hypothetical protein
MELMSVFAKVARDSIASLGQTVIYRGTDRVIETSAVIIRGVADIGFESRGGESHWTAELIVADVGEPRRLDTLADSSGRSWTLREELSGDEYTTTWSLDRA